MPRQRSYSRVTRQALSMLGKLIRVSRAERGLTAQELADRAGISRTTLSSIEKGAPGPEIGIVFEVASIVGVRLFDHDERTLQIQNARLQAVGVCTAPAALVPKPSEFFLSDGSFVISPRTTLAIAS